MTAFDTALAFTLPAEGGYVDNPADPGGATNCGITQTTYDLWRKQHQLQPQAVKFLTASERISIYHWMYWEPGHCDDLPLHLAVCHFDVCVNSGLKEGMELLQRAVGVTADGVYGPATKAAIAAADDRKAATAYVTARRTFYVDLVDEKPNLSQFLPGWLKRCDKLDAYLAKLP